MADDDTTPAPDVAPAPAPEPPPTPAVAAPVVEPEPVVDTLTELQNTVAGLVASVASLTDIIAKTVKPDESPVNGVPWTHRGGSVHHEHESD